MEACWPDISKFCKIQYFILYTFSKYSEKLKEKVKYTESAKQKKSFYVDRINKIIFENYFCD